MHTDDLSPAMDEGTIMGWIDFSRGLHQGVSMSPHMTYMLMICYVAICDCRNLWLKVSQFVMDVAICDGKRRNLWQLQDKHFNDIYLFNFDKYVVHSSYLYWYEAYLSHLSQIATPITNCDTFNHKLRHRHKLRQSHCLCIMAVLNKWCP